MELPVIFKEEYFKDLMSDPLPKQTGVSIFAQICAEKAQSVFEDYMKKHGVPVYMMHLPGEVPESPSYKKTHHDKYESIMLPPQPIKPAKCEHDPICIVPKGVVSPETYLGPQCRYCGVKLKPTSWEEGEDE